MESKVINKESKSGGSEESNWKLRTSISLKLNLPPLLLFLISFLLRTWHLTYPDEVVFDEMHYGKFISLYMKRIFFFDHAPPLGKIMLALAGYYSGFDGNFEFENIGTPYPCHVPYTALRFLPALFGSLISPTLYYLILQLGVGEFAACLAGVISLLDNSLLTQSRFILLDTLLIFLCLLTLLVALKFMGHRGTPYTRQWLGWGAATGVCIGLTVSMKYAGFFTIILVWYNLVKDYLLVLSDKSLSRLSLFYQLITRVMLLLILPLLVYMGVFYIHLSVLHNAGPHDNIMSSAFQASLVGGLASITAGQPSMIAYGSQITLRHTHGSTPCWLHSHAEVYPMRYDDGRGSSHEQQVTCYTYKDVNNWWIVKNPNRSEMVVSHPPQPIKHGDVVQLVHGMTSRALNSHDVAAAMSPYNQEVSCYIDYNVSIPAQNLWRVELDNGADTEGTWQTIHSHVRLIHLNSSQALSVSGQQLPDWGYNQYEVVTDRKTKQTFTIWNVEEHRYTKYDDEEERMKEMGKAELIPTRPTQLTFLEKFLELQYRMLTTRIHANTEHKYSSLPFDWPLLRRGIAYWLHEENNAQVFLVGNLTIWISSTFALFIYAVILIIYIIRRRRLCFDLEPEYWCKFMTIYQYLFVGYLINFLPYFLMDQTLFLHHYLSSLVFKLMLLAAVWDYLLHISNNQRLLRYVMRAALSTWLLMCLNTFIHLLPLSYGWNVDEVDAVGKVDEMRLLDTWDLITHESQRQPMCKDALGKKVWCM